MMHPFGHDHNAYYFDDYTIAKCAYYFVVLGAGPFNQPLLLSDRTISGTKVMVIKHRTGMNTLWHT